MNIYPSILSDDPRLIAQQLVVAAEEEDLEVIQFDLIDGYFADNITVSPTDLGQFDFGDKQIDLHIMTYEPLDMLYEAQDQDELPIRSIIGQVEKMSSQASFLKEIRNKEWLPGLSLDLFTPLESIDSESWQSLKVLQIMSIEAGFQGQQLQFSALKKVKEAAEYISTHDLPIELIVDGGVKLDNIAAIAAAGAESVTIGSGLWQADDFCAALDQYQTNAEERIS